MWKGDLELSVKNSEIDTTGIAIVECNKSWFCQKCPLNNNDDCGPWFDDNSTIFKNCKSIHQNHSGWKQYEEPEKTMEEIATTALMSMSDQLIAEIKEPFTFARTSNILYEWEMDLNRAHVGDSKTKVLTVTLLASSKRKNHEQSIIIQKQSSAGGSNLQNSSLEYFDNKVKLTRMTAAYLDRSEIDYSGKILAIGEMSGFDSSSASLRQKLSEGKTELATTDKDDKGRIITNILRTEGRPTLITTTTSFEIHPEFENRCWILGINETQDQTKAINKFQFSKDTFEFEDWVPDKRIKNFINSDILKDWKIINPFSEILGNNFPCDNVTARRDSKRFADLTTTITYLYQYQRIQIKTKNQTYILTAFEDLQLALYYGQDALKNTLNKIDEKSEKVLEYIKTLDHETTRNDLCKALSIPYETMKRILTKLVNRSFVEVIEIDRIWKYKISNKIILEGLPLGLESDFEKASLEYLKKHSQKFHQVILPRNYQNLKGIDKKVLEYLLTLKNVVTDHNGNSTSTMLMPVTTSPSMPVIGTNHDWRAIPITKFEEDKNNVS